MTTTNTTKTPALATTIEGTVLTITFGNGKVVTIDSATLTLELREAALMHGLKQKLVDAAAISRNTETGKSATIDDKYAAVADIADRLKAGEWNRARSGGGDSGASLLLRALVKLTGKDRATLTTWLEGKTKAEKAALRADAKIAAIIAEFQAASASVDTDSLLGELSA